MENPSDVNMAESTDPVRAYAAPAATLSGDDMLDSITVTAPPYLRVLSPAPSMPPVRQAPEPPPQAIRSASVEPRPTARPLIPQLSSQTEAVIAQVRAQSLSHEPPPQPTLTETPPVQRSPQDPTRQDPPSLSLIPYIPAPPSSVSRTGGRRGRRPRRRLSPTTPHKSNSTTERVSSVSTPTSTPPRRGTGSRGGRPRGSRGRGSGRGRGSQRRSGPGKRKRGSFDDDESDASSGSGSSGDTSSSEEVTALPSTSRSGRRITQTTPSQATPTIMVGAAPASASPPTTSPRGTRMRPPAAKRAKRTPGGASAVCKNCGRAHSPASNPIAFCDGCNAAWHRFCHEPPIRAETLTSAERDWFCADCVLLRDHSAVLEGKGAGDHLSVADKRKYLKSLSPGTLVTLLLHASALHPGLPIYPPKPQLVTLDPAAIDVAGEIYELVDDELPYPKAGNGVQLPPETTALHLLVDDDTAVYSHCWSGVAGMMAAAGWPARNAHGVRTGNAGIRSAG